MVIYIIEIAGREKVLLIKRQSCKVCSLPANRIEFELGFEIAPNAMLGSVFITPQNVLSMYEVESQMSFARNLILTRGFRSPNSIYLIDVLDEFLFVEKIISDIKQSSFF
jgi:hypothetical protein